MKTTKIAIAALALGLALGAPLSAQLPSASTPALGMGDNFTAAARGYHAIAWNPALLGLRDNPGSSLALAPARLNAGLGPVSVKDIAKENGRVVSDAVKQEWLNAVTPDGEQGSGGGEITALALQIGNFGFQISSQATALADLAPGAVEMLLYGNAGRTGQPEAINLEGSKLDAMLASTAAGSFAIAFGTEKNMSLGVTAKYTMGHFLLAGRDQGSTITSEPEVRLNFPLVGTVDTVEFDINNGAGFGLDIGFALQSGTTTFAATVQNVFNTFKWKTENLRFIPGSTRLVDGEFETSFDQEPYANAPTTMRTIVEDLKYKPTVAAGIALMPNSKLTLSGDVRTRLGGDEGIITGPKFHAGAGAEYKLSLLRLRVGGAVISEGFQFGGGLGIDLGPFNISASALQRNAEADGVVTMLTLISTGR